jgi:hypothetical protein
MTSHTDIVANKNDKNPLYVYFVGGVIVVDGAAKIAVMFHDGTRVPAELIGSDRGPIALCSTWCFPRDRITTPNLVIPTN